MIFFLLFVIKLGTLPSGSGYFYLGKKGVLITSCIHGVVIILCIVILIIRTFFIRNYLVNGIEMTTFIKNVRIIGKTESKQRLEFSYDYMIDSKIYTGNAETGVKKEYFKFTSGAKILIIVDPENCSKSLFVQLLES
jgi:hypothetical protein